MREVAPKHSELVPRDAQVDEVAWLERILEVVRERKGVDFGGYRRATLLRRVRNRTIAANVRTLPEYFERLRADPGETDALIERLTIKVSRFFRDPVAFEALERALERRRAASAGSRLRLWSAGCGQGEEPYSLAILLDELGQRVAAADVLGTDIDATALALAARGRYLGAALEETISDARRRYFEARPGDEGGCSADSRCVRPELRARLELRRHDLTGTAGPPAGGRFDLICCRNVLIYFQPALQEQVLRLLRGSLAPGGLLCLGEAEWLHPAVAASFDVIDRRARLFELRGGSTEGWR